jgi:hypothetical protein
MKKLFFIIGITLTGFSGYAQSAKSDSTAIVLMDRMSEKIIP